MCSTPAYGAGRDTPTTSATRSSGMAPLAATASAPGALTVPAPVLMSYLLIFATGAKRTERRMQNRPGYHDYQQRVAFFVPRPKHP